MCQDSKAKKSDGTSYNKNNKRDAFNVSFHFMSFLSEKNALFSANGRVNYFISIKGVHTTQSTFDGIDVEKNDLFSELSSLSPSPVERWKTFNSAKMLSNLFRTVSMMSIGNLPTKNLKNLSFFGSTLLSWQVVLLFV